MTGYAIRGVADVDNVFVIAAIFRPVPLYQHRMLFGDSRPVLRGVMIAAGNNCRVH
jgi:predicted tellurium resistance membrane protein TerC